LLVKAQTAEKVVFLLEGIIELHQTIRAGQVVRIRHFVAI